MKNRKLILVVCLFPFFGISQTHLKNQQFIDIGLGTFDGLKPSNYAFGLSFGKYNKKLNENGFEITYAKKEAILQSANVNIRQKIPIEHFIISYKRGLSLAHNFNNTSSISIVGKANIGYEFINKNSKYFQEYKLNNSSDYILGIVIGPEIQIHNLYLGFNTNLNFISKYQKFTFFPSIKYRIHI
jgi:Conjugative transposon protein TraO